jgi:hypothetical protein
MSCKQLVTFKKNEHLRGTSEQLTKRDKNIARYEMCGDERQYELHKSADEGERIRTSSFPHKSKR